MDGTLFSLIFVVLFLAGFLLLSFFQHGQIRKSAAQNSWRIVNITWAGPRLPFSGKKALSQGYHVEYEDEKRYTHFRECDVALFGAVQWEDEDQQPDS